MTAASAGLSQLAPGGKVELFMLDTTRQGGQVYRFCNSCNEFGADVVWRGDSYTRFPIEGSGFEKRGQGAQPRPAVRVANVSGLIGLITRQGDDLVGCPLTRVRVLARYLDAVNFKAGNPLADPAVELSRDVWFIERKSHDDGISIEFELASAVDIDGARLPRRQIIANACAWAYRGAECGYVGAAMWDVNDAPTANAALDRCGKRLSSCRLRFAPWGGVLNFGGFPAAALVEG